MSELGGAADAAAPATDPEDAAARRRRATALGAVAVLLWSMLAVITTGARRIPPFELTALAFAISALVGLVYLTWRGRSALAKLKQRPSAWLVGVGGLFGFHFFYFVALAQAPPVEASLITYLWPLLIVLFSAFVPGEKVGVHHLAGAALGLAGAFLLVTRGAGIDVATDHLSSGHWVGYLAALGAALAWSIYSVLNRRFGDVPTEAVAGFCAMTALLALASHALLETWVTPTPSEWLAIAALGIGPVGAAFFVWDHGTKHGDLQLLGTLAYGAPLLSTLLLVLAGQARATWEVLAACVLIVGGALLAAKELWSPVAGPRER